MKRERIVEKACPVVLRTGQNGLELLAFEHPLERKQVVKGTVEDGESPQHAAGRELTEESGLTAKPMPLFLGSTNALLDGFFWYFYLCAVENDLPDGWVHYAEDDGGHMFTFFWHPLTQKLDAQWHPLFHSVIKFINEQLKAPIPPRFIHGP